MEPSTPARVKSAPDQRSFDCRTAEAAGPVSGGIDPPPANDEGVQMPKVALYVPLEAKPGKEKEVADFLKSALPLVDAEPATATWFAIQEGPTSFAIFDTFNDE